MKRLLTGLVLAPLIGWVMLAAPQPVFVVVLAIIACLSFYEYVGIVRHIGLEGPAIPGFVLGLTVLLAPGPTPALLALLAVVLLVVSLRARDFRAGALYAALMLLGIAYVFGCWRAAVELRLIKTYWVFFAVVLNWAGDTGAYYCGRAFGRHKLAPRISPGKSWEGAVASVASSVLFGGLFLGWLAPQVPLWEALLLSAVGNIAGQAGDLCESALKRGAGVKDSSNLLPGHGGWLDRVDSCLFAVPVVYSLLMVLSGR